MLTSGLADAELLSEIAENIEGVIRSVWRADSVIMARCQSIRPMAYP